MDQDIRCNTNRKPTPQEARLLNPACIIIQKIKEAGGKAYIVGGFVRDYLLHKEPKDLDIATSLKPGKVLALFNKSKLDLPSSLYKAIPTGIDHGTITVVYDDIHFEITTFRNEKNCDGRHANVSFVSTIEEDLARRDFTINAMAFDKDLNLIDPYNGRSDLIMGLIRSVGDPKERFQEDYLRMLRAIRFSCQLGFKIETETRHAIIELHHFVALLSKERIREELNKMILAKAEDAYLELYKSAILDIIIPEFHAMYGHAGGPHHDEFVDMHTFFCLRSADYNSADLNLKLAVLLHDIAKPFVATYEESDLHRESPSFKHHDLIGAKMAEDILTRLKYSNDDIDDIVNLIKYHLFFNQNVSAKSIRKLAAKIDKPFSFFKRLALMRSIDSTGNLKKKDKHEEIKTEYLKTIQLIEQIETEKPSLNVNDLKLRGSDIVSLGVKPGPQVGIIQRHLLQMVLEDPTKDDYNILRKEVERLYEQAIIPSDVNGEQASPCLEGYGSIC